MNRKESYTKNTKFENLNGSIEVKMGEIIVKNPVGAGEYAKVIASNEYELIVNGKKITSTSTVKEKDEIIFKKEEVKGKRNIQITTNEDDTEAWVNIKYEHDFRYEIKDSRKSSILQIEFNEIKGEFPQLLTVGEVIKYLQENKIIMGLKREEINIVEEQREITKLCVAKSSKAKDAIQDKVKILYNSNEKEESENTIRNIDYKNIISIESVKKGNIIAEIIKGSIGKDGISVYGKKIKAKPLKELRIKIGNGCKLEGNKIIATIDGKISTGNNKFQVNKLHKVNGDVDIQSGNINFFGDVIVSGKVTDGMSVVANSVNVQSGSFKAKINTNSSSIVLGNILDSEIKIGGQDLLKQNKIHQITLLKEELQSIVENITLLKEKNLIAKNLNDGSLIKTLIETKYKSIPRICTAIASLEAVSMQESSKLVYILKNKLIGAGPIGINDYMEIKKIIDLLDDEKEALEIENSLDADLTMEYCQEANIDVMGEILICGKGCYTSKISAMKGIEFKHADAVCRGGHLKAREVLKLKSVGSTAGVETQLEVDKKGSIYADIAYHNTIFILGKRRYVLLNDSRNVHVYIGKDGDIIVDKFNL